jgi:hypothetical protein
MGSTFGQGTSWVPLALAGVGGALAGAGRAGSPASQLGMGLVQPMLSYYANQAATADERARRMKMEDDWIARQKAKDEQAEQHSWADLALKSGQYDPSLTETPGSRPITFGKNTIYLQKRPDFSIEPFVQMAEAAFPGSGETYRKSMEGVPASQRAALAEPMFKAAQMAHGNTQTQNFYNTIGAMARPKPIVTPEMELGMGTPPPMSPPSITGDEAALYQQGIQFPETRQQSFKQLQERLAELTPGSAPTINTTAKPGETVSVREVFEAGKRRPRTEVTRTPENPQRALDTKETAFTVAEGERLEKSPGYNALYQAADAAGKEALTSMLNGAKQGIPADLQSLRSAMANTGTTADTFDKAKLAELKRTGRLSEVIQNQANASDPDRQAKQLLVNNLGSQIKEAESEITTIPPKHQTYPAKAKALADKYRMIADASPKVWGKIAFQRMAELLGWDQATYKAEASAFAAQHGLSVKGGQ